MASEVSDRSVPVILNKPDFNEDGTQQNPTVAQIAEELEKQNGGKHSVRTVWATFWCESEEFRHSEFDRVVKVWPSSKYILYGPIEWTEENKKPHCHVIFAFASGKMFKTIIKTLKPGIYCEIKACRNFQSCKEYALKDNPDDKLEYGKPLKQGLRTDLINMFKECHFDIEEIKEKYPDMYVRYNGGTKEICQKKADENATLDWLGLQQDDEGNLSKKEYKPTVVHWFYGPTGTGKTKLVKEIVADRVLKNVVKPCEITIIDKFSQSGFAIGAVKPNSKIIIMDEFRGSTLKMSELIQIINGKHVEIKGSRIYLHVEEIFITSCYSPYNVYSGLTNQIDKLNQLLRRITDLKYIDYTGVTDELIDIHKYDNPPDEEIFY